MEHRFSQRDLGSFNDYMKKTVFLVHHSDLPMIPFLFTDNKLCFLTVYIKYHGTFMSANEEFTLSGLTVTTIVFLSH